MSRPAYASHTIYSNIAAWLIQCACSCSA